MVIIPTIIRTLVVCTGFYIFAATASAATYYIDYAGGSDSNSGTSKSSPWQRCPGMQGFNQNYLHAPGDHFIFKGGVTWPASVFPMTVTVGGASDSARDYYGVDPTWFTGGGWGRPIFDGQRTLKDNGVVFAGGTWFQVDNIEFKNFVFSGSGQHACIKAGWHEVWVSNCYIHDWSIPEPVLPGSDGGEEGGLFNVG